MSVLVGIAVIVAFSGFPALLMGTYLLREMRGLVGDLMLVNDRLWNLEEHLKDTLPPEMQDDFLGEISAAYERHK